MKRFLGSVTLFTILGLVPAISFAQKTDDHNFEVSKNLEIFHDIVSELDRFYVDTINPTKIIETGIQAMLKGIDPYTEYFPENDMNDLKMMTTGKYAGIGALIRQYSGRDYIYIDEGAHSFTLRGTDSANLAAPHSIEVYMATELCPQHPELLVYDTLRFTMTDDTPEPTGIGTVHNEIPLAIYPNPASETLTVTTDGLQHIDLLDIQGRRVATASADGSTLTIDISRLPAGLYTLRAITDSGIGNAQVIIQ